MKYSIFQEHSHSRFAYFRFSGDLFPGVMIDGVCYWLFCYQDSMISLVSWGARWSGGRVSDSGARGRGFDTYLHRVVSLSKDTFTPRKVLVISRKRWLRLDMSEKLLTGTLSINTN